MTFLRILFVLAGFAVVLVMFAPMQWAISSLPLERHGVRVESASGSVWNGSLSGVSVGDTQLGNVDLRLGFGSVVSGRPELRFTADMGVSGVAKPEGSAVRLSELSGRLPLARVQPGWPANAELLLDNVELVLDAGGCRSASGRIQADGMDERVMAAGGPPGPYAGTLRCSEGEMFADLQTADGAPGPSVRIGRPAVQDTP